MSIASYMNKGEGGNVRKLKESAMTQMYENNMKNFEFQQKKMMMMGAIVNNTQEKLPPEVIKQIKKDYHWMYFGFVSINWGMGKTLGVSWQKGLEQMDAYVATKTKIAGHPVNNELVKIHSEFRKEMAKTIMTNPYVDDKLTENLKVKFLNFGTEDVKTGKNGLDATYQKYMPKKTMENTKNAQQFGLANQKAKQMLQQLLMQQKTNQYAA